MKFLVAMANKRNTDHHHQIEQFVNNPFDEFVKIRGRSSRTGSLALPNNSLLDLYDKQQEQCHLAALLPPTTTTAQTSSIRRHSSHCCPMILDEQQQQHANQLELKTRQNQTNKRSTTINHSTIQSGAGAAVNTATVIGKSSEIIATQPPPPIPKRTFNTTTKRNNFLNQNNHQMHQQQQQQHQPQVRDNNTGRHHDLQQQQLQQQYQIKNYNAGQKHFNNSEEEEQSKLMNKQNSYGKTVHNNKEQQQQQQQQHHQLSTLFYNNKQSMVSIKKIHQNNLVLNNNKNQCQLNDNNDISGGISNTSDRCGQKQKTFMVDDDDLDMDLEIGANADYDDDDEDDDGVDIDDDCDGMSLENSVFDEPSSVLLSRNFNHYHHQHGHRTIGGAGNHQQNSIISNDLKQNVATPAATTAAAAGVATGEQTKQQSISTSSSSTNINNMIMMNNSRHSNRSSSDSNKSQITVDTGYMSLNGSTEKNLSSVESRINGGGNGGNNNINNSNDFRSRFSSVDTQSSLDSCLTEKTIDSPLSKESFRLDSGRSSSATNQLMDYCDSGGGYKNQGRNLPAVPIRKQFSVPTKTSNGNANRPIPPTPPLRQQQSVDSINCQILNNCGTGRKLPKVGKTGCSPTTNQPTTMSFRNKISSKIRPPPIAYLPKLQQRQDSSISSDSFSMTSSPGYNSKSMEVPLIQHNNNNNNRVKRVDIKTQNENEISFSSSLSSAPARQQLKQQQQQQRHQPQQHQETSNHGNLRQDSTISSDSFSQISSPGYNTKNMEAPLLPSMKTFINSKQNFKISNDTIQEHQDQKTSNSTSPITKSTSTPASLQTVVRFQNGTSNMSLQHRILNRRKSSVPYVNDGRLKFRILQILINALALLAIAGGLVAYFNAYPTIKFINKTIITPIRIEETTSDIISVDKNPAPGICLPIIVRFCQTPHVPYNYTVFPNYIGHFGQLETQVDLESYDALVDVRCYELVSLFLCTLFVPKCGSTGTTVPPCKSLCTETKRRCGFFFDVFGLSLPDYLKCHLFPDSMNPDECVGNQQVKEIREESLNPTCSGFLCDQTRCIPTDWRCDGHVDCLDQTDESNCEFCDENSIYCGEKQCMDQKHMCDGTIDCPYGQDERSCIRLSERNGDIGKGFLEIYKIQDNYTQWVPACITSWDQTFSPTAICSILGYNSVTHHQILKLSGPNSTSEITYLEASHYEPVMQKKYQKNKTNIIKEFSKCPQNMNNPLLQLTCNDYECGKIRNKKYKQSKRIVGGHASSPGDWPFLAAILGGPEEIFYCAGVLIADQWVLTASHCIGNHTLRDINDWTIQLGVTRRNSHTYYGQKLKVINVIPHPQYNTEIAHDNDIALFKLAKRVAFHEHLLPVCLPPPNLTELKAGTYCTVIGWGKREDKNVFRHPSATTVSYELSVNEVKVPVVKREICDEWLESLNVTEGMICAGYAEGGKDACQGDSGGPLLCPYPGERDKWFVGGIVSWGILCAHPKLPGVYANVPKYISWIKNEIQKHSDDNNQQQQQQQQHLHHHKNIYYNNNNNNDNNNNKKLYDNKMNNNNNIEPDDYN